jgi:hypothetical protein
MAWARKLQRRLTFRSGAQGFEGLAGISAKSFVGDALRAKINFVAPVKHCSILAASVLYSLSMWWLRAAEKLW